MPPVDLRPREELAAILARHGLDIDTLGSDEIRALGLNVDPAEYRDGGSHWDHVSLRRGDGTVAAEGWAERRGEGFADEDLRLAVLRAVADFFEPMS